MPLPTNIYNILNKNIVEQVRIECKKNWNPNDTIKTIAAFANDIDNFGGGYVIIGAEFNQEKDEYFFHGLSNKEIDIIQQEITTYCLKCIKPEYVPMSDVISINDKNIVVIWSYAGYDKPYKCKTNPTDIKHSSNAYYVRKGSTTIEAKGSLEKELLYLGEKEPFDDRINYNATIDDISINLINEYLRRSNSDLYKYINSYSKVDLMRNLRIIGGPNESLHPRNIGLLMFSNNPSNFIPYSNIDLVILDDINGKVMTEKKFTGSLVSLYDDVMFFIKNNVISSKIIKNNESGLSQTYYNYPLNAIDEIITNAILHKNYQEKQPISIRVEHNSIYVTSYPGFDSSISDSDIRNYNIRSDRYRNRRISEFLKELNIVEAHNTGIPTILNACDENDSDYPIFITDNERSFLTVKLPINKHFIASDYRRDIKQEIINLLANGSLTLSQLSKSLGYEQVPGSLKRALKILLSNQTIKLENKKYSLN